MNAGIIENVKRRSGVCTRYTQDFAFLSVELHSPFMTSVSDIIKIRLKNSAIVVGVDFSENDTIISKKMDFRSYQGGQIVNVN